MTFIIIMKERRYKILWQSTLSLGENKEVPPHHFFLCSPSSNSRRSNFLKRWAQRALFGSAHSAAATVRRCRATVQTSKTTTADTEQGHLKKWTEIKADDMDHFDICHTLVKIQSIHSTQYYALFWALFQAAKLCKLSKKCSCFSSSKPKFYWNQMSSH